jgi:hypothetical protein
VPCPVAYLFGVAAVSATSAWAVGNTAIRAVILHWDGKAWKLAPSPSLGGDLLLGVAARSTRSAWAVGSTGSTGSMTIIVRWNGKTWKLSRPAVR